jgi:hypothetical protein
LEDGEDINKTMTTPTPLTSMATLSSTTTAARRADHKGALRNPADRGEGACEYGPYRALDIRETMALW